jgi:phosphoribosyl 1,2-cyclic phosphodiesterase
MGGVSFTILASGSKGNAALICTETTRLLIDCGLSVKELAKRMAGQSPIGSQQGDAIILSHEHGDHAGNVGTVVRSAIRRGNAIPVYVTPLTAAQIDWGSMEAPPIVSLVSGSRFMIGDIEVGPFTIPHDCVDPVNFVFRAGGIGIGFSTDLGSVPPAMKRLFRDCRIIVLESNHDTEMLLSGTYPEEVKMRISGPMGHLSNDQAAEYLSGECGAQTVVLCHLSEDNNLPELAEWSARRAMLRAGMDAKLMLASQSETLEVLTCES